VTSDGFYRYDPSGVYRAEWDKHDGCVPPGDVVQTSASGQIWVVVDVSGTIHYMLGTKKWFRRPDIPGGAIFARRSRLSWLAIQKGTGTVYVDRGNGWVSKPGPYGKAVAVDEGEDGVLLIRNSRGVLFEVFGSCYNCIEEDKTKITDSCVLHIGLALWVNQQGHLYVYRNRNLEAGPTNAKPGTLSLGVDGTVCFIDSKGILRLAWPKGGMEDRCIYIPTVPVKGGFMRVEGVLLSKAREALGPLVRGQEGKLAKKDLRKAMDKARKEITNPYKAVSEWTDKADPKVIRAAESKKREGKKGDADDGESVTDAVGTAIDVYGNTMSGAKGVARAAGATNLPKTGATFLGNVGTVFSVAVAAYDIASADSKERGRVASKAVPGVVGGVAGGAAGAKLGAAIGAIAGPIGIALGAAVGGLAGGMVGGNAAGSAGEEVYDAAAAIAELKSKPHDQRVLEAVNAKLAEFARSLDAGHHVNEPYDGKVNVRGMEDMSPRSTEFLMQFCLLERAAIFSEIRDPAIRKLLRPEDRA